VAASIAYHLQMDGQTERVNQEVEKFLQIFVNQWQDNWLQMVSHSGVHLQQPDPCLYMLISVMMDTGQNP